VVNTTKATLYERILRHENVINYLKEHSSIRPNIDAYTLVGILEKYIKRLRDSIFDIKRMCQKNDIKGAMRMRAKDLQHFKT